MFSGVNRNTGYQAGLREPRGLRGLRMPRPYSNQGQASLRSPTQQGSGGASFSPDGRSGSLMIGGTSYTWNQNTGTLTLSSAITPAAVPHTTPPPNAFLPTVQYDPVTDTWIWQ
jgi:hypothetical protein